MHSPVVTNSIARRAHSLPRFLLLSDVNLIGPERRNIAFEPFRTAVRIRIIAQSYGQALST
jgi:hypothetical protein